MTKFMVKALVCGTMALAGGMVCGLVGAVLAGGFALYLFESNE